MSDDLISREALKNELDNIKQTGYAVKDEQPLFEYIELPDLIEVIDKAPTVEQECYITGAQWNEFIQAHRKALRNGSWVPVKERLPDKNGRYLVTNYNLVCLRRFSVARNEFGYFDNTDESYNSRWISVPQVIAWMPLPEPYKEAEE